MTKFGISQLHSPSPGEANSDWWAEEDLLVIHYTGTLMESLVLFNG